MGSFDLKNFSIMDIFKYPLQIVLLYLYIFQPPVLNKNIYILIELVIFAICVLFFSNDFKTYLKVFKIENTLIISIIVICILRDILSGEIIYSDRFLAWFFQSFLFGFMIITIFSKRGNIHKLIPFIYYCSIIAAILTVVLLLNKSLNDYYKLLVKDGSNDYLSNSTFRYRAYGFSENLNFTYSYLLGSFAGLTYFFLHRSYFFSVLILLLLVGVSFNARIGFFPILIFILISFFSKRRGNILILIFSSVILYGVLVFYFEDYLEVLLFNKDWISSFFFDIIDTILGTNMNSEKSTINTLLDDFVVLPKGFFNWIIGTGESLFGRIDIGSSDNGFIIQLYYGGLLLLTPILIFIGFIFNRLQVTIGINHWFFIYFFLSILILNTKGFVFAATPGGRLIFFFYVFTILISKNKLLVHDKG